MKHKYLILLLFMACLLTSCSNKETVNREYFSLKGEYIGFIDLPEYTDAETALKDGCYVIVSEKDDTGRLYGGGEYWDKFLEDSGKGKDAFLRVVYFIEGKTFFNDIIYTGGEYFYFDNEYEDLRGKPYKYLRKLEGIEGNPAKESFMYVFTDSLEITLNDAHRKFVSSSTVVIDSIPDFQWLGFTTYLDK